MKNLTLKYVLSLIVLVFLLVLISYSFIYSNSEKIKREELNNIKTQTNEEKQKNELKIAEEKNYLMGKFDPSTRNDFVAIPTQYTVYGNKMYLRKETLVAFMKMLDAANNENIYLKISSATRNFDSQKNIWNTKWSELKFEPLYVFKKILEYSAVPGTSRHHWGTDIDINAATPEYFNGKLGTSEYQWLVKNAPLFGFCQPYNLKGTARPTGYNEEKWHWSYLPLAKTFTQEYKSLIKEEDITGFLGDENVLGQDLINDYVLGINSDCL